MSDYRARIYEYYVHARQLSLAPTDINGLKPRAPYLKKLIRDHFPPNRNAAILDLGCGHGALIYFAQQAGYQSIVGVDRSPEQVAEAKRLGIKGVREDDLMETLKSLPDASQDAVITFDVVEHFRKEELLLFVDEVKRVLKTDRKWIAHLPNGESPFFGRTHYGDFTHEQTFTRVSISQLLMASGFKRVQCFEDTPIPHGVKSAVRWILWKLIRGGLRLYLAAETGSGEYECIFSQNFLTVAVK